MNPKAKQLLISLVLGLVLLLGLQLVMGVIPKAALAQASTTTGEANPILVETGRSGKLINVVQVTPEKGVTSTYTETSIAQGTFTTVVVITPTAISHEFNGAGVHMFDADYLSPTFTSTLETLELTYLRVPFGPDWINLGVSPPACNDETYEVDYPKMYLFISKTFTADFATRLTNTIAISNIAQNLGLKIIFLNWQVPVTSWLTDQTTFRELKEERVDDYACFVTEVVKYLTDKGVKISYLEPTNEPSITHSTKISPELYNTFVTTLTTYLDKRELSEIKILGPGLAYLNHHNTGITWVKALTGDGIAAISGWAAHAWDPEFLPYEPEEDILRMKWEEFHKAIKGQEDPDQPKPIFITEYACVNVKENDPRNGICAVKNMLTLLDSGANAVVYWYLREQDWDMDWKNHKRALLTENYEEKPTFTALASVLPFISGDEVKVLETQIDGRITAASFYKVDNESGEKQIIVVLVNSYPEAETVLIDFTEFYTVEIKNGILYISDTNTITDLGFVQCQADGDRIRCPLSLQSNTIATLVSKGSFRLNLPIIIKSVDGS